MACILPLSPRENSELASRQRVKEMLKQLKACLTPNLKPFVHLTSGDLVTHPVWARYYSHAHRETTKVIPVRGWGPFYLKAGSLSEMLVALNLVRPL
jgi:hypothetical protein